MNPILLMLGGAAIVLAVLDVIATTLSPATRQGVLTRVVGRGCWNLAQRLAGERHREWLVLAGPLILAFTVLTWMAMLLLGWWLVFMSGPDAIVASSTGETADAIDRLYSTGYTIFTMGNGDFVPNGPTWQVLTVVATGNGLLLATLAITYMVPVVTAVTQRRQTAAMIAALGEDVPSILETATCGAPWVFDQMLLDLSSSVGLTAERHLAYPLIHFFRSRDRASAFVPNVAALDEVVRTLQERNDDQRRADPLALHTWVTSMDRLLDAVRQSNPSTDQPEDRREQLRAFVSDGGWSWSDVVAEDDVRERVNA